MESVAPSDATIHLAPKCALENSLDPVQEELKEDVKGNKINIRVIGTAGNPEVSWDNNNSNRTESILSKCLRNSLCAINQLFVSATILLVWSGAPFELHRPTSLYWVVHIIDRWTCNNAFIYPSILLLSCVYTQYNVITRPKIGQR